MIKSVAPSNNPKPMTWRIHLTNQAIQRLHILTGKKQSLLAAWTQRDRASYFDLETGAAMGEHEHKAVARQSDKWAEFTTSLTAPNGLALPIVRTALFTLYTSSDGKTRFFQMSDGRLVLEVNGEEQPLDIKGNPDWLVLAFDPTNGGLAALDDKGKLHVYQGKIRFGLVDLKVKPNAEMPLNLAIADNGGRIFVGLGNELIYADGAGKVQKRVAMHYDIGRLACSPDGKRLVTSDSETGAIRLYDAATLTPTHQRLAVELLHRAAQLQLLADFPPFSAGPTALALSNKGHIAFCVSGVVCVSTTKQMDTIPATPTAPPVSNP